jgi:hypothetical protein
LEETFSTRNLENRLFYIACPYFLFAFSSGLIYIKTLLQITEDDSDNYPFKDEAHTALFKDPVRTAL